ncbi:MAG: sensor histidine kinase, partial [Anaerolineae bacterium]|nr:sensor histidine kinase [Anaerolineae bacterium]
IINVVELLEPTLLLGILIWQALRPQYQRVLLPLALVLAGLGPLASQAEILSDGITTWLPMESILTLHTWGSMITLLLPVVIIAWQYRVEHVIVFSVGITLLNTASISVIVNVEALDSILVTSSLIFRMLTFVVIGWLVARMMIVQRKQRAAWKEANRKLTHHAATLEQLATTRERNRLARELHDTLAHTLSAVAVQLEAVNAVWDTKPDQARTRLQKSIGVTRSGLTETRRVLQDLRASPLEDLGLALAVRHLAESTAARGGLTLDLHIAGQLSNVSPDIEQTVYRIAQEALVNVIHHANAEHLTVQLRLFDNHLTLTVSDDGAGFDFAERTSARRFGMQGMHERAEMIGGTLQIESQPGQGTIVMLSIEVES